MVVVENPNTVEKWDIRNCSKEKEASVAFRALKPNKKLNGHGYKQMLKMKRRQANGSADVSIEKTSWPSQTEVNVTESNGTENDEKADADNSVSSSRREGLDFLLRRVKIDGDANISLGSNLTIQTKEKKNAESENLSRMDEPNPKVKTEHCDAFSCKSTKEKKNADESESPSSMDQKMEIGHCDAFSRKLTKVLTNTMSLQEKKNKESETLSSMDEPSHKMEIERCDAFMRKSTTVLTNTMSFKEKKNEELGILSSMDEPNPKMGIECCDAFMSKLTKEKKNADESETPSSMDQKMEIGHCDAFSRKLTKVLTNTTSMQEKKNEESETLSSMDGPSHKMEIERCDAFMRKSTKVLTNTMSFKEKKNEELEILSSMDEPNPKMEIECCDAFMSKLTKEKKNDESETLSSMDEPNQEMEIERRDAFMRTLTKEKKDGEFTNTMSLQEKKNEESETLSGMDEPYPEMEIERCDAFTRESTKPNFVEYWVPVELSEMQTEQYCGTLFSNTDILCSCDSTEILNETLASMLVSTKKCCDHPYLVDGSLCMSLIRDVPKPELLDAEIKLSNKLLLLHKILLEIKKRGLRVLILYQSLGGSQSFSLGDILDEFVDQTLGPDIFVHIAGHLRVSRSKRQVALKSFNDKGNMKFVCLMETRACVPSVKLSLIDTVIIFNSDWNPINDLKALQRIELNSRFEDVNVFRFYSSHTLEEKALVLAKQGTAVEGNNIVSDIRQSTCHELLTWGANYLFEKLDKFHDNISNDDDLENVSIELSNLLPDCEKRRSTVCGKESSFIVKVQQIDGIYSKNVSLHGEVEKDSLVDNIPLVETRKMVLEDPHVFWSELLEERSPRWKYFSSRSRRVKKRVQRFQDILEPVSKRHRREAKRAFYPIPTNIRRKTRSKVRNRERIRKLVPQRRFDCRREPIRAFSEPRRESNAAPPVCKVLELELEGLTKQKTDLLKLHEEKKLRIKTECENEIDRIRRKYDMMLENAETGVQVEKRVIEAKYNKVYVNKSLAEAMICAENTTLSQVTSDCSAEEVYQLFHQWIGSKTGTRPEQVDESLPNEEMFASRSDQHSENLFRTSSEVANCRLIGRSGPNQTLSNLDNIEPSMNLASSVEIPQTCGVLASDRVLAPAPHLRHMRPPQIVIPKMSPPGPGVFQPVTLQPVTSNVQSLQSKIELPLLWEI